MCVPRYILTTSAAVLVARRGDGNDEEDCHGAPFASEATKYKG